MSGIVFYKGVLYADNGGMNCASNISSVNFEEVEKLFVYDDIAIAACGKIMDKNSDDFAQMLTLLREKVKQVRGFDGVEFSIDCRYIETSTMIVMTSDSVFVSSDDTKFSKAKLDGLIAAGSQEYFHEIYIGLLKMTPEQSYARVRIKDACMYHTRVDKVAMKDLKCMS